MPKISELVPDEMLGKVKLTTKYNQSGYWFIPYFKDKDGFYYGLNSFNQHEGYSPDDGWVLFSEPKPKVKRWLWAYKCENHGWKILDGFFSDQEAAEGHNIVFIKIKKLTWSEQEFDE